MRATEIGVGGSINALLFPVCKAFDKDQDVYDTGLDLPSCLFMSALVATRTYSFLSRTLMSQNVPQSRVPRTLAP